MSTLIIGDNTDLSVLNPGGREFGLIPRDYSRVPYGSTPFPTFESAIQAIPRAEWADRIADQERNRSSMKHVWAEALGGLILDQDGLPYCHGFSAVLAVMLQRAAAGMPFVELSGSGVAAPTVNWTSRGAWIMDDLKTMQEIGCPSVDFVPQLAVQKSKFRDGWKEDAATRKVVEVYELRPRSLDDQVTALLTGFAVCTGINWWGHATVDVDVHGNGDEIGGLNSWSKNWGDKGYFRRTGSKRLNDEQYAVRVTVAA